MLGNPMPESFNELEFVVHNRFEYDYKIKT